MIKKCSDKKMSKKNAVAENALFIEKHAKMDLRNKLHKNVNKKCKKEMQILPLRKDTCMVNHVPLPANFLRAYLSNEIEQILQHFTSIKK